MGLKFKRLVKNTQKALRDPERIAKAVATGGISEMVEGTKRGFELAQDGYNEVSGINAAQEAQERALAGLEGDIAQARAMSDVSMEEQLGILGNTYRDQMGVNRDNYNAQRGILGNTYRDQRGQIQSALQGATSQDQQALSDYMSAQGASQDQISQMLGQQAGLQGQFQDSVANASTLDGFGNMLNEVRDSDTYNSLLGERMDAATNQFQDAGLRRSTNAGEMAADISQDTLMGLANQNYNRQLGMLEMGNQGVNNQANFMNNSNNLMNRVNLEGQNAINQRGFNTNMGLSDLTGSYGANQMGLLGDYNNNRSSLMGGYGQNQMNLRDTNNVNQMNLLGQLSQANTANTIAQGQNEMNSRMGVLNLAGTLGGAAMTGGLSLGGLFGGGGGGGLGATQAGYSPQYMNAWSNR